jgi:hypothetical protein
VCKDELKRYIMSFPSLIPIKDSDPLKEWRKTNQTLFPIVANLAKIYLAIQATSAPSGRDPEMAGKMSFVRRNWEWYTGHAGVTEYQNSQLFEMGD